MFGKAFVKQIKSLEDEGKTHNKSLEKYEKQLVQSNTLKQTNDVKQTTDYF